MPTITALLHTENDALRLGRCLETLYPCEEIVIIDHGSCDGTIEVAREYGARVVPFEADFQAEAGSWLLCLDARESLSESLAASLYEWKSENHENGRAFSVLVREEKENGWIQKQRPQIRLVPHDWKRWEGRFPESDAQASLLEGEVLRFTLP